MRRSLFSGGAAPWREVGDVRLMSLVQLSRSLLAPVVEKKPFFSVFCWTCARCEDEVDGILTSSRSIAS